MNAKRPARLIPRDDSESGPAVLEHAKVVIEEGQEVPRSCPCAGSLSIRICWRALSWRPTASVLHFCYPLLAGGDEGRRPASRPRAPERRRAWARAARAAPGR